MSWIDPLIASGQSVMNGQVNNAGDAALASTPIGKGLTGIGDIVKSLNTAVAPAANNTATTTNTAPVTDPVAAAKAAQDAKTRAYINDQVNGTQAGLMQSGSAAGSDFDAQGRNLVGQLQTGQNSINEARKGIAVGQINSIKALVDSIHSGLRSGAVNLAGTNALDSSAAGAVGRIMTQYGTTQRNAINNDAAVKNDAQDVQQNQLGLQRDMGIHGLQSYKDNIISQITNDAQQKLSAIDGIAQLQGVGGAVDINGIKNAVVANAQQKLADADAYIQSQLGSINPTDRNALAQQAYELSNRGVAGSGGIGFDALAQDPAGIAQNGGAPIAQLPLYLKPKTA